MSNQVQCVECEYTCHKNYLASHIKKIHNRTYHEYYDLFLRKEEEGECALCKQPTNFRCGKGYSKYCSARCANLIRNKILFEKFGVQNNFQLKETKEKSKQTLLEKYGVDNPSKSQKLKQKKEQTCLKNYGVSNPSQSKDIQIKKQETCQKRYGVAQPMHNKELAAKAAINGAGRARAERYRTIFGKDILVQGSYEKLFVQYCEANNIYIENGPCIEYGYNNKLHKYFIDFQVIVNKKKKIVEIKSTYWYRRFKDLVDIKNLAAEEYCKQNSSEFLFIINDNNKKQLNCNKFEIIKE